MWPRGQFLGLRRWWSCKFGLRGAPERSPVRRRGGVLVLRGGAKKRRPAGESAKGTSRPNGIDTRSVKTIGRRQRMGRKRSPPNRTTGPSQTRCTRNSTGCVAGRCGYDRMRRGNRPAPKFLAEWGLGFPATPANQALQPTAGARLVLTLPTRAAPPLLSWVVRRN